MSDNFLVFFVAAVMPVAVLLIIAFSAMNKDKLRAQVLIKAIESRGDFDAEKLAEALQRPKKTQLEVLNTRLLYGCIFTLIGLFCGGIFALFATKMGPSGAISSFLISTACLAIGLGFLITYFVTRKQIIGLAEKEKAQKNANQNKGSKEAQANDEV